MGKVTDPALLSQLGAPAFPAGAVAIGAPDPTYPTKAPQAVATLEKTGADTANTAANTGRTQVQTKLDLAQVPYADLKAAADAREAQAKANVANAANLGGGALDSIVTQINDVSRKFASGPGATSGLNGLEDYLPSSANSAFDAAASGLGDQATAVFRVAGTGTQTDKDAARIDAGSLPNRYYRDSTNLQILDQLRTRVDAARAAHGLAPAKWDVPGASPQQSDGSAASAASGSLPPGWTGDSRGPAPTIATGATRLEDLPNVNAVIDAGLRSGASDEQINASVAALGGNPADPKQLAAAREYLRKNPGYKGGFGAAQRAVPTTTFNRIAASPLGSFAMGAGDAATAGNLDSIAGLLGGDANAVRAGLSASAAANPLWNIAGSVLGGGASAAALGGGLGGLAGRTTGVASRILANPLTADTAFGAAYGAGSNDDNRLLGAAIGAGGGIAGGMFGRKVGAALGRRFGANAPASLTPGEAAVLAALQKQGIAPATDALTEAASLGVPMSLADTGTGLRSLAGAAVRRSPDAASIAEANLLPRARGQIDRLASAVTRDLGPVTNIPQTSADIMSQARTAAAPLYDAAYASPAVGSPELDSLLNTPAGRSALARARTIAANERRDPTTMGFAVDSEGNVVLNPANPDLHGALANARAARDDIAAQLSDLRARAGASLTPAQFNKPLSDLSSKLDAANANLGEAQSRLAAAPTAGAATTGAQFSPQTLDYVKRGLDDVIEQLPKGLNGRPIMDENYRAVDGVRRQLLAELDKLNPAYASARAAYAGPAASRAALERGADAARLTPDELAIQVASQSPEHLAQMQAGYRGELMNRANALRDSGNPFEATLGSPAARARTETLYPGNPGNVSLFRTRDLEGQLARTTNDILGNSKTAERQLADASFGGSPIPALAADAGAMALGGVPTASIARALSGQGIRDFARLGLGKGAARKAEQLAPILLQADPNASITTIGRLVSKDDALRNYIQNLRSRRIGGMFGAGFGSALPALVNER